MKKRDIFVLIGIILISGIYMFVNSRVAAEEIRADGNISLFIGNNSCGNHICDILENCSVCPRDCGNCTVPPTPSSGGGGGGGGGSVKPINFTVDRDLIQVSLKQGESKREVLVIKNGNKDIYLRLSIDSDNLKNHMELSQTYFLLKSGESKSIDIDFFAKINESANTYIGNILVSSGELTKKVKVILEVKERKPLFDISTKIINTYSAPGKNESATIKITNLGDINNVNLTLYYAIMDFESNEILSKKESIMIDKELSVTRGFLLPDNMSLGKYVFLSTIWYGENLTATSSDVFEVITVQNLLLRNIIIAIVVVIVVSLIIFALVLLYRAVKNIRTIKTIKKNKEKHFRRESKPTSHYYYETFKDQGKEKKIFLGDEDDYRKWKGS